jgi:hypothetical protein
MAHALARVGHEQRPRDVVVALLELMALAAVVMAANVMWWGYPQHPDRLEVDRPRPQRRDSSTHCSSSARDA